MRLKSVLALSGTVQLVLATSPLYAMQSDLLDMDLEKLLQVSITGATLREESLKTVPSSVTVFTRAQLDTLGLDYLHELLNLVRGFQTIRGADSPFSYAFSVRGRRQSGSSREVLLLVDGRVFTDPRSGGLESAFHLYPLANIEKIEFIRGPASAIYGSGAYTGVINIVSRKQANSLKVGVGENQKRAADFHLSGESDDWQSNFYSRLAEDNGQQYRIGNQTTQDPHREVLVDWNIKYRNSQFQAFYSEQEADDFYVLEKINDDANSYWQTYRHLHFNQEFLPTSVWKMNLAVSHAYSEQEIKGMILQPGALLALSQPASDQPLLTRGELASEAYRINIANDVEINALLSMQFGVEWQHQREIRARSYNNYDLVQWARRQYPITFYGDMANETLVGGEESRNISGIYAQWLYQLNDATRLTAGLRYDHYQSLDTRLSPRLALVHQLNDQHSLKLLYSEAFRAPTFAETHLLNNPVLVGNPDLVSETIKSGEALWVVTRNPVTLEAGIYYNKFEDPISSGFVGNLRTYVNGSRQENYGFGGRLNWQVNERWLLMGHLSSLQHLPDAYFREADQLGSLVVNYQRGNWNWNLSAVYHGEREYQLNSTRRETLPDYWYGNTQLLYQFTKKTSVALAVKNVFDEDYATPSQGAGLIGGVPNRGREASLIWQWEW